MLNQNRKGFTLIELLVVIAIIGILSTLAVVGLNVARQKSRDAKRVADIKQVQTALELYYGDQNGYPSVGTATALGSGGMASLINTGFASSTTGATNVYMGQVPANPTPGGASYLFCSATSAAPTTCAASTESYMITFSLEGATGGLASGAHTASPTGIK
ncbi:MAG: type II secretion system protein [Patescibacteria group bacterium]